MLYVLNVRNSREGQHALSEELQDQRIDDEPTEERKDELDAAYQRNIAADKPPYAGVWFKTSGELLWIFEQRSWSVKYDFERLDRIPEGKWRPDLSEVLFLGINLNGANLTEAALNRADLRGANLSLSFNPSPSFSKLVGYTWIG